MKFNPLTRRMFLQGVGGSALVLPMLESLLPREARAATVTPPPRFVFMGSAWGRHIQEWYPATAPTQISPEGVYYEPLSSYSPISSILDAGWNPLRSKISLIRGLDGIDADHDGHNAGIALTGSGSGSAGLGFQYSIDAVLEESKKFYPTTPFLGAIRTCVAPQDSGDIVSSVTSRSGEAQWLSNFRNPVEFYNQWFNPASLQKMADRSSRQKMISNQVMADFTSVMSSRKIASADKILLDNYMSILNSAELKLGLGKPTCKGGPSAAPIFTTATDLHNVTMDLEIAALLCGMSQIAVHWIWQSTDEISLNIGESHSSAHNAVSDPAQSGRASVNQWSLNRWSMSLAATYLKKLDAVADPSGSGTLLDNTFFLYGNLESRGFHSFYDMPVIVGGGAGKIRTGYYMDFRPRPLNMKGDDDQIAFGRPYNAMLITAFKSLGLVEADYEKFGQKGFGVYDKYQSQSLAAHYAPFVTATARNATLPFLYKG